MTINRIKCKKREKYAVNQEIFTQIKKYDTILIADIL